MFNYSDRGFHPKGLTTDSIIDHEYTHVIENILQDRYGKKKERIADIVMKRVQDKVDGEYRADNEDYVRASVSGYARINKGVSIMPDGSVKVESSYGANTEFIAEAMANARNNRNEDKYSLAVREVIEEMMEEVGLK